MPYPFTTSTASDLWGDLIVAVGDDEMLYEALQSLGLRVGILVECPMCDRLQNAEECVGPCADCAAE